jgi:hypothetical protein
MFGVQDSGCKTRTWASPEEQKMDGTWLTPQWEWPARSNDLLVTQPLHIDIPSWDYHYPRVSKDSLLLKTVPESSASAQEEDQVSATAVIEQDHCYLPTPIPQVQDSSELNQLSQTAQSRQVQEMNTVTEDNEETTTAPEDDDDEVTRDYSELLRFLGGQPSESLPEVDVADVERLCGDFPSKVDAQPQDSSENSKILDSKISLHQQNQSKLKLKKLSHKQDKLPTRNL